MSTSEPSEPAASPASAPAAAGWPDLHWPLVICGYFALQVVWRRLLLFRAITISVALATAGVLASGATNIRPLWLLPVVYLTAPLAAVRLLQRTGAAGARALVRTVGALAVLVIVGLGVNIRYGEPGNPALYRAPVAAAAADLVTRFPDAERIVAARAWGAPVSLGVPETTPRAFPLQPDEPFKTDAAEVLR